MSLQVWLPLNGDLHNQGLHKYPITIFRGTETYNNQGKIGKCFYSNGVNTIKILDIIPDFQTYISYSLCAWFYIETNNTAHSGSAIISAGDWNSQVLNLSLSDWSTDHYTRLRVSGTNWRNGYNYNFNKNTWYHVVVCSDSNKTYAYVNGNLIGNTIAGFLPSSISGHDLCIGGATYYGGMQFFGKINDVRVYNHCLSAKEVEEISKGLVLHYQLNDQFLESTTNLITTEDGLSNTCYNGAVSKYNYGTNTDMYKTTGIFQGKYCTKVYMGTPGKDAYPYVYFDPFNTTGKNIQTLSFDYFPTTQTTLIPYSYNGTYNFSYTTDTSSSSETNINQIVIPVKTNQWNHITITAQKYDTTNTSRGNGYIRIGSAKHTSTTTDYWLFANVQVENKDHATGYAGVGGARTSSIIYDSSGYNNNGTIIGLLETTTPSPRYNYSTYFKGSSTAIKYLNFNLGNIWSASIWFKSPSSATQTWSSLFAINNNSGDTDLKMNIYYQQTSMVMQYSANGQYTTAVTASKDIWHQAVEVFDGTTLFCYLDGELKTTKAITNAEFKRSNLFIGGRSTAADGSTFGNIFNGYLSDFRIYATALTETQVKELYRTSININGDNVLPRDLE